MSRLNAVNLYFVPQTREFVTGFYQAAAISLPDFYQGDTPRLNVRFLEATGIPEAPWRDMALGDVTLRAGLGTPGSAPIGGVEEFDDMPEAGATVEEVAVGTTGVNAVQRIRFDPVPYDGTFTLTFDGDEVTEPIAFDATAAEIHAALVALDTPAAPDIVVSGTVPDFIVTFAGALAETDIDPLEVGAAGLVVPIGKTALMPIDPDLTEAFLGSLASKAATFELEMTIPDEGAFTSQTSVTVRKQLVDGPAIFEPGSAFAGYAWKIKTGNYTALPGDKIACDATSSAFTITLPLAPSNGATVRILDAQGNCSSNNITVGRNSQLINADASNLTISANDADAELVFVGGAKGWQVSRIQ